MADVREDILARLLVVVAAIPNLRSSHRSNVDIDETQLPAVVVLDGDEETNDSTDLSMRPANRPTVVQLTPGISSSSRESWSAPPLCIAPRTDQADTDSIPSSTSRS